MRGGFQIEVRYLSHGLCSYFLALQVINATSSARDVPPKSHYLREIFNILSKVDGGL